MQNVTLLSNCSQYACNEIKSFRLDKIPALPIYDSSSEYKLSHRNIPGPLCIEVSETLDLFKCNIGARHIGLTIQK